MFYENSLLRSNTHLHTAMSLDAMKKKKTVHMLGCQGQPIIPILMFLSFWIPTGEKFHRRHRYYTDCEVGLE